jgi:hypothetical protein
MSKELKLNKKQQFITTQDIIIPAGSVFDNYSNSSQKHEYYETYIGEKIHKDIAIPIRIEYEYMKELLDWTTVLKPKDK